MNDRTRSIENRSTLPPWLIFGFLFWVAFLLVLEPGNVARAITGGIRLTFGGEAIRIVGAALIGGASTPVVIVLIRRYRLAETSNSRNVMWLLFALIALAGVLNIASSFAAAWIFEHRWLPHASNVSDQLIRNWALLTFALASFAIFVETATRIGVPCMGITRQAGSDKSRRIFVKSGRATLVVDVDSIDWMEAQGNYVALHVGPDTHLIRDTLSRLENQIDSSRFVRAHRRIIVAIDRIQSIYRADNGGAVLRLKTGQELVASRRHRRFVQEKWKAL
jgi:hypothetical protein